MDTLMVCLLATATVLCIMGFIASSPNRPDSRLWRHATGAYWTVAMLVLIPVSCLPTTPWPALVFNLVILAAMIGIWIYDVRSAVDDES